MKVEALSLCLQPKKMFKKEKTSMNEEEQNNYKNLRQNNRLFEIPEKWDTNNSKMSERKSIILQYTNN